MPQGFERAKEGKTIMHNQEMSYANAAVGSALLGFASGRLASSFQAAGKAAPSVRMPPVYCSTLYGTAQTLVVVLS